MIESNDWRLTGQKKLLFQKTLYFRTWKAPRPEWDHDHCTFCMDKFAALPDTLHEGYTTKDNYVWICPNCFNDFKEMFQWVVGVEE
ncbi:MAG: hypothetical protein A2017_17525 [Lentisphaerae bacterium GWF2_44_16]|nr:MAG: hypothetical protein A2017_17525 [Lentisphaerae bacterium GWF2_44_16]HAU65886.1 hypothetical protein [Candidatus Uhrbacteria bacterium]